MEPQRRERVGVETGVDARLGPVRDTRLALHQPGGILAAHRIGDLNHVANTSTFVGRDLGLPQRGGSTSRNVKQSDADAPWTAVVVPDAAS